ncbi:MAG TPA: ribosome maturation factor RimM [Vicinamibacterales bacterium]|jgi:16S rRNA processing protein RimM|nr:ribosome maturation factor RimM [Vicinamibacterales bacterium]
MGEDLLLVGRVARAHGNRGQVIVNLETDFAEERFKTGAVLFVGAGAEPRPLTITAVRFHQGRPVIALDGVQTMNEAEALAGADVSVQAASLAPLPAGTFYRHELVGCEVRDRQGALIGRVMAVEGPMDRSHLVVEGAQGEVLIPLVADICPAVDPIARTIVVTPPEGLLELNQAGRPTRS